MNKEELIVEAARRYFEGRFATSALVDVSIDDQGLEVGAGRESWLVRVRGRGASMIVAVEVEPDGRCEARHHVRTAA